MTPEEKRLENAKARLIDAANLYGGTFRDEHKARWKVELLSAAMDYAETVHFVEWLRAKQAEERQAKPCVHDYQWNLSNGAIWGAPLDLKGYDPSLIIGKCIKCGAIHNPAEERDKRPPEA